MELLTVRLMRFASLDEIAHFIGTGQPDDYILAMIKPVQVHPFERQP
jgi:hypothetical protein